MPEKALLSPTIATLIATFITEKCPHHKENIGSRCQLKHKNKWSIQFLEM
jgi:hypothetical protein